MTWQLPEITPSLALEDDAATYTALMLGLRDYVRKNGFAGILLGLSGGIDSALTAVIAVDALGAANVRAVMLPSPYTSPASLYDAAHLARGLEISLDKLPIAPVMEVVSETLSPVFTGYEADVTEENLQARIRGLLLMAMSNKFRLLLLTTGNKSEMAVGYATLYGDMCGGFNVLKDVYKTEVYALSRWRNDHIPIGSLRPRKRLIPARVITRAPTAELREGQKDEDSLPPYETLDAILKLLIEGRKSSSDCVRAGFEAEVVQRVVGLLHRAEFKRRQAAPGVKVTSMAFGRDWRYPLTAAFTHS